MGKEHQICNQVHPNCIALGRTLFRPIQFYPAMVQGNTIPIRIRVQLLVGVYLLFRLVRGSFFE